MFTADTPQQRYIIGFTLICQNNQVYVRSASRRLVVSALIATRIAISESIANEVVLSSSCYSAYISSPTSEKSYKTAHVQKRLLVFTSVFLDFLLYL